MPKPIKTAPYVRPTSVEEIGRNHRVGGAWGNLRAAVFGVNDGLVSNASLIMGFAGASNAHDVLVLSGVAGMLAGAFSMAAGEYVSVRSQRDLYERAIEEEKRELAEHPDEEVDELAMIYESRGVPGDDARRMSQAILADKERGLSTMVREELGINPKDLGSPLQAALASFVAFCGGAFIPVLPLLVGLGRWELPASATLAGVALFGVGATVAKLSRRPAVWGGLRMLAIGALAGSVTHAVGRLFGL